MTARVIGLTMQLTTFVPAVSAVDPGYVTVASRESHRVNAYPSVARMDNGDLLCVFSIAEPDKANKRTVVGTISSDHGLTWADSRILIDTEGESDYDPNIIVIGKRVIVTSTTVPPDHGRWISTSRTVGVRSDDSGKTWSPPFEIPMGRRYTSGKINNGITLRNGASLFGFTWEKTLETVERLESEGQMVEVSAVMVSYDHGRTWAATQSVFLDEPKLPGRKAAISGVTEPAIVECSDGSIYMLLRTGRDKLYECRSRDGGLTWSAPVASPLTGHNAPAALHRFDGQRKGVLVVWNNSPEFRWPLCVAASYDDCHSWTSPKQIASVEGHQSSYPGCTQAADGTLIVVYQQDLKEGGREIVACRFPPEWVGETGGQP